MPKSIRLSTVASRSDLAAQLEVPIAAIDLVSLVETPCKSKSCPLPAVARNHGRCLLCSQTWFPRQGNRNRRGYGLFGPQFLWSHGGRSNSPPSCCCDSALCEKIGYSHAGMFRFPSDPHHCAEAVRVVGIASPEKRKEMAANPRKYYIAPWHYHHRHRRRNADGSWALRKDPSYRDEEGKVFSFPPPNASVQKFIDEEILPSGSSARGTVDDSLPGWFRKLTRLQQASGEIHGLGGQGPAHAAVGTAGVRAAGSGEGRRRDAVERRGVTPPRRGVKKRGNPDSEKISELGEELRTVKAQLESAFSHIEGLEAHVRVKDNELIEVRLERDRLEEENSQLRGVIDSLEQRKIALRYDDLRPGGVLEHHVKDFTYFPDFASNDAFLELLNFSEGSPEGDGLCENLVRYSKVSIEERKEYQEALSVAIDDDAMSISSAQADDEERKRRGPKRKLDWKTEWLVYCFYVHANIKMRRVGALFGIGTTLVHDIVYAWANLLCLSLDRLFPTPTRSQMLRAYPKSIIKKFGHANIFLLLDATEIYTDVASMKTVNAILYSAYKHNSTLKWLAACCPIGSFSKDSIGQAHGGSISDPFATRVSSILESIPYGCWKSKLNNQRRTQP
ncbi:hypothetical protein ACHAWF_013483 [Thalassiosira exigua]